MWKGLRFMSLLQPRTKKKRLSTMFAFYGSQTLNSMFSVTRTLMINPKFFLLILPLSWTYLNLTFPNNCNYPSYLFIYYYYFR